MIKIAIIGAGSIVFCKTLLNDMFSTPALKNAHFSLMGPTMWKLEKMKTYADQIINKNKLDFKVSCTDRSCPCHKQQVWKTGFLMIVLLNAVLLF